MKCWKCHKPIDPNKTFCTSCGSSQEEKGAGKTGRKKQAVVFFGVLLGLVAVCAVGAYYYSSKAVVRYANSRGRQYLNAGQWDKALAEYQKVIKKLPGDVDARVNAAKALSESGRRKEAIALLNKALNVNPAHLNAQLDQASNYIEIKEPKKALEILERAEKKNPNAAKVQERLGQAYQALGSFQKAVGALRKSVRLSGGKMRYETAILLGELQRGQNACHDSQEAFEAALVLNKNSFEARHGLARTHLKCLQFEEALAEAEEAIRLNPTSEDALALKNEIADTYQSRLGESYRKGREPMEKEFTALFQILDSINGELRNMPDLDGGTTDEKDDKKVESATSPFKSKFAKDIPPLVDRANNLYLESEKLKPPPLDLQSKQAFRTSVRLLRDAYTALEYAVENGTSSYWRRYAEAINTLKIEGPTWIEQWARQNGEKIAPESIDPAEQAPTPVE